MALMTTNILPSQSYPFGPGSGKTGIRHLLAQIAGGVQEGAAPTGLVGGDLKVSQRASGAVMGVDVAPGEAIVQGDDTARQGIYHQTNDAVVQVAAPANASGNPRFDQLILHVYDSSIAGVSDTPQLEILQGTAQAGVTIDNRLGAAALPNTAIRLAEWVTPTGAASITNAMIRDRRPWARGAHVTIERTAGDYTTASATIAAIDAVNLAPRIESSGAVLRVALIGRIANPAADTNLELGVDGTSGRRQTQTGQFRSGRLAEWELTALAAGTHLLQPNWNSAGGTSTLNAVAATPAWLAVEEVVRPSVANAGA